MKDPKETDSKQDRAEDQSDPAEGQKQQKDGSNWNEHQQVGEIGNEISPDDVK